MVLVRRGAAYVFYGSVGGGVVSVLGGLVIAVVGGRGIVGVGSVMLAPGMLVVVVVVVVGTVVVVVGTAAWVLLKSSFHAMGS